MLNSGATTSYWSIISSAVLGLGLIMVTYTAYNYHKEIQYLKSTNSRLEASIKATMRDLSLNARLYQEASNLLQNERKRASTLILELEELKEQTQEWNSTEIPEEVLQVLKRG